MHYEVTLDDEPVFGNADLDITLKWASSSTWMLEARAGRCLVVWEHGHGLMPPVRVANVYRDGMHFFRKVKGWV